MTCDPDESGPMRTERAERETEGREQVVAWRPSAQERLWQDNIRLRAELLREVPTLDLSKLAARAGPTRRRAGGDGRSDKDTSREEPLRAWLRDRRVFALEVEGRQLVPAFQLNSSGQPRPVVRDILARLPPELTPWQIAFWFISGYGWLGGASPCERLDDAEAVLAAAERLADPAVG